MMRTGCSTVAVTRVQADGDETVRRLHSREAALLSEHATPRRRAEFAAGRPRD